MISKHLKIAAAAIVASVSITASADAAGTGYIFVSNEMDNTVSVIDGESFEIVKTIPTGQRPRDMRWSIDKTQLLVAVSRDDRIDVIEQLRKALKMAYIAANRLEISILGEFLNRLIAEAESVKNTNLMSFFQQERDHPRTQIPPSACN